MSINTSWKLDAFEAKEFSERSITTRDLVSLGRNIYFYLH